MDDGMAMAIGLLDRVAQYPAPAVVAIDGRSGAGKSTLAASLAKTRAAVVVEGDAFYAGGLALRTDTAKERADACIDRPKLRSVLEQLRAGRAMTFRGFDWTAFDGRLSNTAITVEPAPVVLVEGVYSSHPDLADLLSAKILLSPPDSVRRERLIRREGTIGPWERQWHEAEDWYFAHMAPTRRFDLVIE